MTKTSTDQPAGPGSGPVTRSQTVITAEAALAVVGAALAEGERAGVAVSACVVDTAMALAAFARADGATPHSVDTSRAKANTAASTRRATGWMGAELAVQLTAATGGRLTNIRGGVPVTVAGDVVGALGVAGGTPEQDEAVATAALDRTGAR